MSCCCAAVTSCNCSWWWTGKPSVLQPTGSQRVGHDWATELNWGFPALHCLPESAQTHVHWVSDANQPPHALPPPSPSAFSWVESVWNTGLCRRWGHSDDAVQPPIQGMHVTPLSSSAVTPPAALRWTWDPSEHICSFPCSLPGAGDCGEAGFPLLSELHTDALTASSSLDPGCRRTRPREHPASSAVTRDKKWSLPGASGVHVASPSPQSTPVFCFSWFQLDFTTKVLINIVVIVV